MKAKKSTDICVVRLQIFKKKLYFLQRERIKQDNNRKATGV